MSGLLLFGAQAGTTVIHELQSEAIAKNHMGISSLRRILVYLPEGYQTGEQRYPTIYWIPGWRNPATTEYERGLNEAIRNGEIPPVIVVSIHVAEGTAFLNSRDFGYWEDFLVKEVVPFVDATYRTIPDSSCRAIMGHSMGGYAALILPVRHPGIWGAVGINDGSVWAACHWSPPWALPERIEDYGKAQSVEQVYVQLGTAISPNGQHPLHFDSPWDAPPNSELAAKWDAYCLQHETTLAENREILLGFSKIAVLLPDTGAGTNRIHEQRMLENMRNAGIPATGIVVPGGHDGHRVERFMALASVLLEGMAPAASRAITPDHKRAVLWGRLRDSVDGSHGNGAD